MKEKLLRTLAISLLDTEDGISDEAYTNLQALEANVANGCCDDIFNLVEAAEGHFFLPETHGIVA